MSTPPRFIAKAVVHGVKFVCPSLAWKEHLLKSFLVSDYCAPVALLFIECKVSFFCQFDIFFFLRQSHFVVQVDLKLMEMLLPQPSQC